MRNGNIKQTKFQKKMYTLISLLYRNITGLSMGTTIGDCISIGNNVWVGYGTKIVTSNHDLYDPSQHQQFEKVILEDDVWVGANCVILPGIHLGPHTIVGAGSIVTKSFPNGYCIIAGNPAKEIKKLSNKVDDVGVK